MGVTKQPTRLQSGIQTHIKTDSLKIVMSTCNTKREKLGKGHFF